MKVSDEAEELLETLWIHTKEETKLVTNLKVLKKRKTDTSIEELLKSGLITMSDEDVKLSDKGLKEAKNVVRRHRLAERLLVDVLDVKSRLIEDIACRFEHQLHKGIDDSICTLLGHPKFCPHGKLIPHGKCCLKNKVSIEKIVAPLSDLSPGQEGKIAYIHTKMRKRLQKLMAMGILPGKSISLIQKFPSYVFQVGQTQIATDKEIANDIYVRLVR